MLSAAGTNLSGVSAQRVDGRELNAPGMYAPNAVFDGSNFSGAILSDANLSFSSLRDVNFAGADLSRANFTGAHCAFTIGQDTNLAGAVFHGANIGGMRDQAGNPVNAAQLADMGCVLEPARIAEARAAQTGMSLAGNLGAMSWAEFSPAEQPFPGNIPGGGASQAAGRGVGDTPSGGGGFFSV